MLSPSLRSALRYATKEAIWSLGRFRQGEAPPIALFATRRGGSTWLMEVIAANRGVRYIDQPFSLFRAAPGHVERLPIPMLSQYVHLEGQDEERVRAFVADLLNGSFQVNAPWEPWKAAYDFTASRVVLKILNAKALIDWFDQHFGLQIVYATRHPIPTALSILRNGWPPVGEAYLRNPHFCDRWLRPDRRERAAAVLAEGNPFERLVLDWILENVVPLRLLPERPHWLWISYEEALLHPEATIEHLATALALPDRERMLKQVRRPSRSTKHLVSTYDAQQETMKRLGAWREQVTPEQQKRAADLLDAFEIDLYRADAAQPTRTSLPSEALPPESPPSS